MAETPQLNANLIIPKPAIPKQLTPEDLTAGLLEIPSLS